jgi:hypothetical protein
MNPTPPTPPEDRLMAWLRTARPSPAVPPQFAAAVWRRIEAGEVDIPAGPWWLMRLADWLAQPRRALAVLAVLMLLGAGTGLVQGWMRSHEVARARYLAAVSPQEPGP